MATYSREQIVSMKALELVPQSIKLTVFICQPRQSLDISQTKTKNLGQGVRDHLVWLQASSQILD